MQEQKITLITIPEGKLVDDLFKTNNYHDLNTTNKTIFSSINELKTNKTDKIYVDEQNALKQNITDNTLNTTDKTVPGAINEVLTNVNLKQNIVDNTLHTTDKTVPGAINEIYGAVGIWEKVAESTSSNRRIINYTFPFGSDDKVPQYKVKFNMGQAGVSNFTKSWFYFETRSGGQATNNLSFFPIYHDGEYHFVRLAASGNALVLDGADGFGGNLYELWHLKE